MKLNINEGLKENADLRADIEKLKIEQEEFREEKKLYESKIDNISHMKNEQNDMEAKMIYLSEVESELHQRKVEIERLKKDKD